MKTKKYLWRCDPSLYSRHLWYPKWHPALVLAYLLSPNRALLTLLVYYLEDTSLKCLKGPSHASSGPTVSSARLPGYHLQGCFPFSTSRLQPCLMLPWAPHIIQFWHIWLLILCLSCKSMDYTSFGPLLCPHSLSQGRIDAHRTVL